MKQKIYLSGPISGHDYTERKEEFAKAKAKLKEQGFEVFNPMENGLPANSSTADHMKADLKALLDCDGIYMMRRWNHSAGCQTELLVALAIGLDIKFELKETITCKDWQIVYNIKFE